jgi:hypothetical protein
MISIGILTYYAPKTLENTLLTYKKNGLFDHSDDVFVVIQYSKRQQEEKNVCDTFGIRSILLPDNGKMAWGFRKIYEHAKNDYILFLENDFIVCTMKEETDSFFANCHYFLKDCNYDVVRGRSRNNAGEPNYAYLNLRNIPKENFVDNTHLSECIYWIDDPEIVYPTRIKRIPSCDGSGKWYTTTSRYCNYTNNPYACSKAFFAKAVLPYIEFGKDLEKELTGAWSTNQYTCVFGPGLFTHDRAYDGHI